MIYASLETSMLVESRFKRDYDYFHFEFDAPYRNNIIFGNVLVGSGRIKNQELHFIYKKLIKMWYYNLEFCFLFRMIRWEKKNYNHFKTLDNVLWNIRKV